MIFRKSFSTMVNVSANLDDARVVVDDSAFDDEDTNVDVLTNDDDGDNNKKRRERGSSQFCTKSSMYCFTTNSCATALDDCPASRSSPSPDQDSPSASPGVGAPHYSTPGSQSMSPSPCFSEEGVPLSPVPSRTPPDSPRNHCAHPTGKQTFSSVCLSVWCNSSFASKNNEIL